MNWSWFLILLATYPWLLASDLISDAMADTGLVCFLSGAAIVAPARRFGRGQAALFALCVGFMFEARRPLADGWIAFPLAFAALAICGPQGLLRRPAAVWFAAIGLNVAATAVWLIIGGAGVLSLGTPVDYPSAIWRGAVQTLVAAGAAAIFAPFMLRAQESLMDRLGVPEAREA
ncbi:MAG: hypothetical protein ACO268_03320 [Opitutales bacterium]|jgi:hypothetical protein